MKANRLIIPLIMLLLTSCDLFPKKDKYTYTSADNPWSNPETEDLNAINEIDVPIGYEIEKGTMGGELIEIAMNRFLGEYSSYECIYTPSTLNKEYRVVSTVEEVLTVTQPENNKFTINTLKAGDTVLKIYNGNDEIVYRKIVRVRYKYKQEDVLDKCYKMDVYDSWTFDGDLKLMFDKGDDDSYTCYVSGVESEGDTLGETLSLTYAGYEEWADSYYYTCETLDTAGETTLSIIEMLVSLTADQVVLYYNVGTATNPEGARLATFIPENLSYIHSEI